MKNNYQENIKICTFMILIEANRVKNLGHLEKKSFSVKLMQKNVLETDNEFSERFRFASLSRQEMMVQWEVDISCIVRRGFDSRMCDFSLALHSLSFCNSFSHY